jgi:hypothetical protein
VTAPSLRANGSRERAPDDRLSEAIHLAAKERMDCFVANAPRNDESDDKCTAYFGYLNSGAAFSASLLVFIDASHLSFLLS